MDNLRVGSGLSGCSLDAGDNVLNVCGKGCIDQDRSNGKERIGRREGRMCKSWYKWDSEELLIWCEISKNICEGFEMVTVFRGDEKRKQKKRSE